MQYEPNYGYAMQNVLKQANFDTAEADWKCAPDRATFIDVWRWQGRNYVTLMAYIGGTCYSGIRVPMPKEEWR